MKLYFDEDSAKHQLIGALRSHAIDAISSLDAGMNGRDDEAQLTAAAAQRRVMISANTRDFAFLHQEWLEQGRVHSGILIIPQQRYTTGEILRRILRVTSSVVDFTNGLYYLSNF